MPAPARGLALGAAVYAVTWFAAALLWRSYEAVPVSLFFLVPLAIVAAGLAGGLQGSSPRSTAVWSTGAGALAAARAVLGVALAVGAAWMPVEPATFAAFLLLASPALFAATAAGHALQTRRTQA